MLVIKRWRAVATVADLVGERSGRIRESGISESDVLEIPVKNSSARSTPHVNHTAIEAVIYNVNVN